LLIGDPIHVEVFQSLPHLLHHLNEAIISVFFADPKL
jgi:hypothetical protein